MEQIKEVQNIMKEVRLGVTAKVIPDLIQTANNEQWSYIDFLMELVGHE